MLNLSDHMHAMSDRAVPLSYPLQQIPPVITTLECKVRLGFQCQTVHMLQVGQWVRIAFRGVAGAHLYKVTPCFPISAKLGRFVWTAKPWPS